MTTLTQTSLDLLTEAPHLVSAPGWMLRDVEITLLKRRGWTISAIARHVGRDRKTVRGYLSGEHEPGVRAKADPLVG